MDMIDKDSNGNDTRTKGMSSWDGLTNCSPWICLSHCIPSADTYNMMRLVSGISLLYVCVVWLGVVAVVSEVSVDLDPVLTLENEVLSFQLNASNHALIQLQNKFTHDTHGVGTDMLNSAVISESNRGWWNALVLFPNGSAQIGAINATHIHGQVHRTESDIGTDNIVQTLTLNYSFSFPDAGQLSLSITATLSSVNSQEIEFTFHAGKGSDHDQIGVVEVSVTLQGINPNAFHLSDDVDPSTYATDVVVLPVGFGTSYTHPLSHLNTSMWSMPLPYPCSYATYPMLMYYFNSYDKLSGIANGPGVSIETRDPIGSKKLLSWTGTMPDNRTMDLGITMYPINAGNNLPNTDLQLLIPYPVVFTVFAGDWSDGSLSYGEWARGNAEWVKSGPIADRVDIPSWMLNTNFWVNTGWQLLDILNQTEGDPKVVQERIDALVPLLNLSTPLGVHWYEWHQIAFDTGYPEYFPYKPGFDTAVQSIAKEYDGAVRIIPYINARIFDQHTSDWTNDQAELYASKSRPQSFNSNDLSLYNETYGSGALFAVMCPATNYWQEKLESIAAKLNYLNVDGLYLDQIAAAIPKPCADPTHGHTVVDGQSFTMGNIGTLDRVRSVMKQSDDSPRLVITESNGEPYMAHVHMYLTLFGFIGNASGETNVMVPVFPAMSVDTYHAVIGKSLIMIAHKCLLFFIFVLFRYGGLYTSMGQIWYQSDLISNPDLFASKLSWQLLNGAAMGWLSLGGRSDVHPPQGMYDLLVSTNTNGEFIYASEIGWIGFLDRFRSMARTYLIEGRRTRDVPFRYTSTNDDITTPSHSHHQQISQTESDDNDMMNQFKSNDPSSSHISSMHPLNLSPASVSVTPGADPFGPFVWSGVQGSAWRSANASSLALFFTCSLTPSVTQPATYTLNIHALNLIKYGVPGTGSELDQSYALYQWSVDMGKVQLTTFSNGTNIDITNVTLECRGAVMLTLEPI
jgi:hypothetical protein